MWRRCRGWRQPVTEPDVIRLVVVGGGITGLAAAWEASGRAGVQVTVLESAPDLGGKVRTSPFLGRRVDEGADAFLCRVPEALQLCRELGIADTLVHPAQRAAFVWVDGLRPLPQPSVFGIPLDATALAESGLVSTDAVRYAADEPHRGHRPPSADVSIGGYLRPRLGDEVVDRLVGPLVGGINAGEVDRLSLDAVLPQVAEVAHRSPSLLEGLRRGASEGRAAPDAPVFAAPPGGMTELVTTLAHALAGRGVTIEVGRPVTAISPGPRGWSLDTPAGTVPADVVVLATPAANAAGLLAGAGAAGSEAAALLAGVRSASVAMVTLAYRRSDVPLPLDGSGFLVPRSAGLTITAASWTSSKWAHLDDGDHVLLRVSAGHDGEPETVTLPEDDLMARVGDDLARTMGIDVEPVARRITRWVDALPQYEVGHLERMVEVDRHVAAMTGVAVTGAAHRGIGIPACIRQGRAAVSGLFERVPS